MPFEYGRYGFNVGCSNLDEYPSPEDAAYYPGGILYTLPGPCPTKGSAEADPECTLAEPGGLCEGEPTGYERGRGAEICLVVRAGSLLRRDRALGRVCVVLTYACTL